MAKAKNKQQILEELGNIPESIYDELVMELKTKTSAQVMLIKKYLEECNFEEIRKIAHSVKGSSSNLRIYNILDTAKNIEIASQKKDTAKIFSLVSELDSNLRKL